MHRKVDKPFRLNSFKAANALFEGGRCPKLSLRGGWVSGGGDRLTGCRLTGCRLTTNETIFQVLYQALPIRGLICLDKYKCCWNWNDSPTVILSCQRQMLLKRLSATAKLPVIHQQGERIEEQRNSLSLKERYQHPLRPLQSCHRPS